MTIHSFIIFFIGVILGVVIRLCFSFSSSEISLPYKGHQPNLIEVDSNLEDSYMEDVVEEAISCDGLPCISTILNLKKSNWEKVFDKKVECLQKVRTLCSETKGIKQEDATFIEITDVVFDVEKEVLYVQHNDLEAIQSMFPYLSIMEASSTKETVEWPNAQPWLFLLPSDQYQILSVAFLFLHSFLYPTSLPAKTELLFPSINQNSTVFPEGLLPLMARSFDPSLHVVYQKDLREQYHMIHFNKLILLGMFHRHGVSQVTQHPFDSDFMRAVVYKEYVKNPYDRKRRACFGVYMTSLPGGKELRINERAISYASRKLYRLKLSPLQLSSFDLAVVVKEMAKVDLILAVSGPSLSLAMFMLPQSAVLEILPKYQKEAMFYQLAVSWNLQHFAHYQLSDSAYEVGEKCEGYVDPTALWVYLQDIVNMVLHNKYHI